MVFTKTILLAAACALTASATPIPRGITWSADMLLQIDPSMATCASSDECATAAEAAPALVNAFSKYKITDPNQQAALVAYMYFESGHFVYNKNHFPGRPGQGTRMMAMPPFVAKYAAAAADPAELQAAQAKTGDEQLTAILATVNKNNDLSFGSAAWFLSTQCSDDVKAGLSAGSSTSLDGWHNFLSKCVGTPADPARDPSYVAAMKAVSGSAGTPATPSQAEPSKPAPSQAQPSQAQPSKPSTPSAEPAKPSTPTAEPSKPSTPPAEPSKPSTPQAEPTKPAPSQSQPTEPSSPSKPAPATPSATGSTPAYPSNPTTGTNTCTTNGAVVCNGQKQFGLCNNGSVVWQDVALGTSCVNGVIS